MQIASVLSASSGYRRSVPSSIKKGWRRVVSLSSDHDLPLL